MSQQMETLRQEGSALRMDNVKLTAKVRGGGGWGSVWVEGGGGKREGRGGGGEWGRGGGGGRKGGWGGG